MAIARAQGGGAAGTAAALRDLSRIATAATHGEEIDVQTAAAAAVAVALLLGRQGKAAAALRVLSMAAPELGAALGVRLPEISGEPAR